MEPDNNLFHSCDVAASVTIQFTIYENRLTSSEIIAGEMDVGELIEVMSRFITKMKADYGI